MKGDLTASSSLNQRLNDALFRAISPEIKSPSGGCTETLMLLFSGADVHHKSLNKPVIFECMNGDNASMLKLYNEFGADMTLTWNSKDGM